MENLGYIYGIETEYEVIWLKPDQAMLTVDGDEVVTFSSAYNDEFLSKEDVLDQAADVILDIEGDLGWDSEDDEW